MNALINKINIGIVYNYIPTLGSKSWLSFIKWAKKKER